MPLLFPLIPLLLLSLLLTGTILLTLGLHGRPSLSSPRCSNCHYDLRTLPFLSDPSSLCPECGSPLSSPDAVSFGHTRRSPKRITLGILLILSPFATLPLLYLLDRATRNLPVTPTGPAASASLTTPQLLAHLPSAITTPWDWQELERRHAAATLSKPDIDQAISSLISHLNAQRAAGQPQQPLHWANPFVDSVFAANELSPARTAQLLQAFYDLQPQITLRPTLRQGSPIFVRFDAHAPWDLGQNQFALSLNRVTADDDPTPLIPIAPTYPGRRPSTRPLPPDQLSGTRYVNLDFSLPQSLPLGTHTLTFTSDLGALPQHATFRGLDGLPGTPNKWPNPRAHWQSTTRRSITIVPKDQPIIDLVTDENANPFHTLSLHVTQAAIRPASNGLDLLLSWSVAGSSPTPLSYHITLHAGPQSIPFGTLTLLPNQSTPSAPPRTRLPSLPFNIHSLDITLTPDPQSAESSPTLTRIWALPHTLKNIPLARYDLEPTP